MTAQVIQFPTHPLETRINAHFQMKNLPYAARFVCAPDPTVDDELQFTHDGTPMVLTVQISDFNHDVELSGGGTYLAIMENGETDGHPWVRMHGEFQMDAVTSMASFFTRLTTSLKDVA